MGARYYDPTLGRFTEPDPSATEANPLPLRGQGPTAVRAPTSGPGTGVRPV
ncbi:hypothetical protein [Streptomyces sp. NBC_00289]|uniref:hypothetical protein n=1 Tax=Streptomyces sp. NBC_00289 TaxID=2975703 RepID=UPI00352CA950